MIGGMTQHRMDGTFQRIHPLLWLLAPGLLAFTLVPPGLVLLVTWSLLLFVLPGIFAARLLLPATAHRYLFWATVIPAGYGVSTALTVAVILVTGFHPGLCFAVIIAAALAALIYRRHTGNRSSAHTGGPSLSSSSSPSSPSSRLSTAPSPSWLITGLLIGVLLVGLLVIPYSRVGTATGDGIAYRAYYSGDYLKHVAVTAELTRGVLPPDNPYFAGKKLHYYWMFYVFPALMTEITGPDRVEDVLQTVNLLLAGVFIGMWVFAAHALIYRRWARLLVMLTPFCFASFEGVAVFREVMKKGWPWDGFRAYNVDGYTRWILGQPEVDTLFRLIQYNMQHIIPAAFFIVFLMLFSSRTMVSRRQAAGMGLVCALSIGHSGFLGSFLTLWTGLCLVILGPWNRRGIRERLVLATVMALPPLAALFIYKTGFQMLGNTGNPLMLTLVKPVAEHPIRFLLLNFGIAVTGLPGIFFWRRGHRPAIILATLAMIWVACVIVPDWPSDVGVKVGYTLAMALALLTGRWIDRLPDKTGLRIAAPLVLIPGALLALPTLAMEVYNSADIENDRYVSRIDPVDWDAYRFMRRNLSPDARIQTGPNIREANAPFSPIPTFAHRHTYCGDWMHAHIFLIPERLYKIRLDQVRRMYTNRDPAAVHSLCRNAGITHLYWGTSENENHGAPHHLLLRPDLFISEWAHIETDRRIHLFRVK